MKAATQRNKVLQHLSFTGATLTRRDAMIQMGIGNLPARIEELRKQGWDIVDDRKKHGTRYSIYRLRTLRNGQGGLFELAAKGRPE